MHDHEPLDTQGGPRMSSGLDGGSARTSMSRESAMTSILQCPRTPLEMPPKKCYEFQPRAHAPGRPNQLLNERLVQHFWGILMRHSQRWRPTSPVEGLHQGTQADKRQATTSGNCFRLLNFTSRVKHVCCFRSATLTANSRERQTSVQDGS